MTPHQRSNFFINELNIQQVGWICNRDTPIIRLVLPLQLQCIIRQNMANKRGEKCIKWQIYALEIYNISEYMLKNLRENVIPALEVTHTSTSAQKVTHIASIN